MSILIDSIRGMLKNLKMHHTVDTLTELFRISNEKSFSYERFLETLLSEEIKAKELKRLEQRLKQASFPEYKTLEEFDLNEQQSLSQRQLNQLKELTWIEQGYNLILLGPPGVGKTLLATGLGIHMINIGYKAIFTQISDLIYWLKTQEIISSSCGS